MAKNLFGTILNNILGESLGEVIVNPSDTSKNMFSYQLTSLSEDPKNPDPVIVVHPSIDSEDIATLKKDPKTSCFVNRKNNLKPVVIHPETMDDPNSNPEEYQALLDICNLINGLGKYGNIDPNDVIKDGKIEFDRKLSLDVKQVKKDEAALWDEFLDDFNTPRVQMLLMSIENFSGLDANNGLDWTYSRSNMMKILSQDNKRVAAGKQPATFVAKPQDWRMYNRQIKDDAIPIWLIYKKDPGYFDKDILADVMTKNGTPVTRDNAVKVHREMEGDYKTYAPSRYNKYTAYQQMDAAGKTLPRGYGWGDYYDIDDTEVIPGLEDRFPKDDRQGFLDNLKLIPTKASSKKFAELDSERADYETTKTEINKLLGVDESTIQYQKNLNYTYASLYSIFNSGNLKSVDWNEVINTPTTEEKKVKIFDMVMKMGEKRYYGNNANMQYIIPKAQAVACLYVCSHRIAPVYGMDKFEKFKKSADFLANVKEVPTNVKTKQRQYLYDCNNIYKDICDQIEKGKDLIGPYVDKAMQQQQQQQQQQPQTTSAIMQESVSRQAMAWVNLFKEFDDYLEKNGIDKDGNDITGINMSPEAQQLSEAKFYSLFYRMNQTRI